MQTNVGSMDKTIRVILGIGLIFLATTHIWWPWGWIGLIPLATGLFGWCPAYQIFGLNTCPAKKDDGES